MQSQFIFADYHYAIILLYHYIWYVKDLIHNILCYSSTIPVTLRPCLAAPVVGVNSDNCSALSLSICSNSSGLWNTAASVNCSKPICSSGATPLCICNDCNSGNCASAAVNNCLACACDIPALCNLCANSPVISNPALAASPPICAVVILPATISSPTVGSNAPTKIA